MKRILIILGILALLLTGAYFVLTQTRPAITKTAQVGLSIKPAPDFTLEVFPAHIESPVGRVVAFSATVTAVNNFAGEVVFSVSGVPAGCTVTILPGNKLTLGSDAPRGVQINIDIGTDPALVGDYTLTVTAESTNYN